MKKLLFLLMGCVPFAAGAAVDDCMTRTTVPDGRLNLPQVIDLGLCRNPQTAASYMAYE
ncbi:MAG: hypothetical protein IJY77_02805 [Alphaproteobacteria bacterium]|nr:hypothetical protein [Alphaproteobacteria bacterium]